jgi:CheY-like chemotaxis protein
MEPQKKVQVMMLDDEKFLLDIYKKSFQDRGYEVAAFYDVDSGLKALREGYEPAVILFDLTIPESKSGYDFLKAVQTEGLGKKSLKIAFTNEEREKELARLKEMGADSALLKAKYIPTEVVTAVAKILVAKRGQSS